MKLLTNVLNDIYRTEVVPRAWLYDHITPHYKGKGSKEELKNHRGITVSSNIEQTFERVINQRVQGVLPFTETQAECRSGRSTIDQLFTLKSAMKQAKGDGRQLYIAFLDIQKAYDKAWLDAKPKSNMDSHGSSRRKTTLGRVVYSQ